MVAESIVEGVVVNAGAAAVLKEKLEAQIAQAFVTLKIREPKVTPEVLASPKQLADLLFHTWDLPVIKLTDKGQASTDREVLTQLALQDTRAMHVNNYREAKNNLTKFVDGSLASVSYNGDGHTRPQARIFGTYTGRMTYSSKTGRGVAEQPSGVALHQWKRDPDFRRIVSVDDDEELLEFDFAGQEFRWMAVVSGDSTMLGLCMPGEDAHAFMGGRCTGVSYQDMLAGVLAGDKDIKVKRQFGKVANLGLGYRTSAKTLVRVAAVQHKIALTYEEAHKVWLTYRQAYKQVPVYWKRQISRARQLGYVDTLAGRRITLGTPDTWVYKDVDPDTGQAMDATWSHESTAINFPVQGVGADQKYLAMRVLKDYLPKVDGRFAFELHDGLFVRVPKRYADRAVREIRHLLSNLPYKKAWGVDLPIQFPVDAKRGPTWGDLKEVKE
jgi:DNA polymerase-1